MKFQLVQRSVILCSFTSLIPAYAYLTYLVFAFFVRNHHHLSVDTDKKDQVGQGKVFCINQPRLGDVRNSRKGISFIHPTK